MRAAPLVALPLFGALLFAACAEEGPLPFEREQGGFDPVRYDAGTEPPLDGALPDVVRFGITPFYTAERQRRMLERMQRYLEDALGARVEPVIGDDYLASVEQLARGELDVAQLSPYACIVVEKRVPELDFVATAIAQGASTYASYLVVRRDDAIVSVEDARGKRLGLTERLSTSGYLYPRAWLKERGLDAERDFQLSLHGQHDALLRALLAGEVDVAAISSDTLVTHRALGLGSPVRIIAKMGRIPYDCVVARRALPAALKHRIRKAFLSLSIHSERGRFVLEDYNLINGFMPIPEGHYDEVKKTAALAPLP